jgi:hypothetical protein
MPDILESVGPFKACMTVLMRDGVRNRPVPSGELRSGPEPFRDVWDQPETGE